MAYVTPNSDLHILQGVPLDKDYNNTLLVSTSSEQYQQFSAYIKYTFNNLSYQRVGRKAVRVNRIADDLYCCNYMMFRNTSYGSKWFYAFVDSVNYINDNCTEIEYTIDVMQTYLLDYYVGDCFIEREHSKTDVVGDNRIDENVELGTYIYEQKSRFIDTLTGLDSQYAYIFATSLNLEGSTPSTDFVDDPQRKGPVGPYIYNEVITGVQYAAGLLRYSGANTNLLTILSHVIQHRPDTIMSLHLLPVAFINYSSVDGNGWLLINTSTSNIEYPVKPATWTIGAKDTSTLGTYTPKNKKLLTYPYNYMLITNNEGSSIQWRYEDFPAGNIVAELQTNISPDSVVRCAPRNYKGLYVNLNESIVMSGYPLGSYSEGAYETWFAQHSNSMFASLTAGLANSAMSAFKTAMGASPNPSQSLNSLLQVGSTIAMVKDMETLPATVRGNIQAGDVNIASDNKTFVAYHAHIRPEFARIIDDYFTKFGYACHRVKSPIVYSEPRYMRPYWNYLKTSGCMVHSYGSGTGGLGVPAEAEKEIAKIHDNGITFWSSLANIGDYTLDNSPRP